MNTFSFKIEDKDPDSKARAGIITTPHGFIHTPAFVNVATKATVKALSPEEVRQTGGKVILANTYHLYLQPGHEIVRMAGGLHKFMNWNGPIMTDSGGFQVFSLGVAYGKGINKFISGAPQNNADLTRTDAEGEHARLMHIDNEGVSFRSHLDGSEHRLTPEKSIKIQHALGADIIFAFDECTSPTASYEYQREAIERTHAWARRSLEHHKLLSNSHELDNKKDLFGLRESAKSPCLSALFGIVQGGRFEDLRRKSAQFISNLDFAGFGIGGSFVKEDMEHALRWVTDILPEEKPRHLLGVGEPGDLLLAIENGADTFDCVAATRQARNGTLYTKNGIMHIENKKYREDFGPIEKDYGCSTCSLHPDGTAPDSKSYIANPLG